MAVSMHGLDLSFLRTKQSRDFIRRERNRHLEAKRRVPIASKRSDLPSPRVMSDIQPFVSPVTREVISSRSSLERHNRANGVRQCGEVDPQAWVKHVEQERHIPAQEGISFEWTKFET